MTEYNNNLFLYLQKEQISLDEPEFKFQIQSHPDYPSLLALSDTLNFYKIENGAIPVEKSEIDLLPKRFLTLLSDKNHLTRLCYLEKKGERYICSCNKSELITRDELEKNWRGIVLLAEKTESRRAKALPKQELLLLLLLSALLAFGMFIIYIIQKLIFNLQYFLHSL